jgi:hypothetical protein
MNFKSQYNKIAAAITNLMKGSELRAKVTQGGALVSAGNGLEHITRFIRNMILTRLLLLDVFGVRAIVLAIHEAFESFTEIGLKQVIIQNKKSEKKIS